MKNTITTFILALLLFSGCVNTPEENIPQNEVICSNLKKQYITL